MQKTNESILLSASDLIGHLNCGHLTDLDVAVAMGTLAKPKVWDPLLEVLWERGARHEQGFVEHLKSQGFSVALIAGIGVDDESVSLTRDAMHAGVEIIVQGAFRSDGWVGRTDILRRVESKSALGAWSYEVIDTKLARETKGATVLQLCLYAALVESVQGLSPANSYVVAPWSDYEPQPYRMDDYAAFYRRVKRGLASAVGQHATSEIYPDPKEHCDICRWSDRCDQRRRTDDHLSLVAGITKVQIDELKQNGVNTLAELAAMPIPLKWKPKRGSAHSFERVREQARLQFAGRAAGTVLHEMLPVSLGLGLSNLPMPSRGDIFLDLEGDPFVGDGGLEYLFGYVFTDCDGKSAYIADWALSRESEKQVFERFIDFVVDRLQVYPNLHIYHYAPYEPAALKRLMGRHATREEEFDSLLRSKRLIDLYSVVRHGLRASVESYSIKRLEPLYDFTRETPLSDANKALARVQSGLELGDLDLIDAPTQDLVAGYNRDDCDSTWHLRNWLESRRDELVNDGVTVPRPDPLDATPSDALTDWQQKITTLIEQLTIGIPLDIALRSDEEQARWLLAHSLDWHRREQKSLWWEYFRLADLPVEDLLDERAGLADLLFVGVLGGTTRAPIHRYSFPPQETDMRGSENLHNLGGEKLGVVHGISMDERWVDIKKRGDSADIHPQAVFSHTVINTGVLADALVRIGEHVVQHGIESDGPFRAALALLMRLPPTKVGHWLQKEDEQLVDAACRVVLGMESGILPIQGPPGSGKTFTGARMICELVQAGKTVGVCANSHKVIRHLLDKVIETAEGLGIDLHCIQKAADVEPDQARLRFAKSSADLLRAIGTDSQVAGATAWLWAAQDAAQAVDVLFIDEAAQMALANVLAVSHAASCIVMLGDPQQLEQPIQGHHPEGSDISALHHILGDSQTIAADRGLFLSETWRLHPDICAFTSEVFYASRLHPHPGLEIQAVDSPGRINGTGLRYLAVPTNGNQSSSPEEADAIHGLVNEILESRTTWTDMHGVVQPVTLHDILIIAPYNAQVFELNDRIGGARIGTVDKFQGQEAPIVIYSMTTSSYADAPRGMDFLYSPNRLNVATSRARCLCILVASPSVFEVRCRTPRQMQLANAFCRYLELATNL